MSDEIDLRPLNPFYRIQFNDGARFDYSGDPQAMRAEIARFDPGDIKGYANFMRESEAIYRIGFERLGDVPSMQSRIWRESPPISFGSRVSQRLWPCQQPFTQ